MGAKLSDSRFTVIIMGVIALVLIAVGSLTALQIAGRSPSSELGLVALIIAPTITSLVGLTIAKDTNSTIKNGLQDQIATKTATLIQGASVVGGKRASDPPAVGVPSPVPVYPPAPPPTVVS